MVGSATRCRSPISTMPASSSGRRSRGTATSSGSIALPSCSNAGHTRRRTSMNRSPSAGSVTWCTSVAPWAVHDAAMATMARSASSPAVWMSSRHAAVVSSSMWYTAFTCAQRGPVDDLHERRLVARRGRCRRWPDPRWAGRRSRRWPCTAAAAAEQLQAHLGDHPEDALGPDEHTGEVEPGGVLQRVATGADDLARRQHHLETDHVVRASRRSARSTTRRRWWPRCRRCWRSRTTPGRAGRTARARPRPASGRR